jgi:hypothetical protein
VKQFALVACVIAAAMTASYVVQGLGWGPPADAQPPKPVSPAPRAEARPVAAAPLLPPGRFQLVTDRDSTNRNASVLYLVDTATGQTWYARRAAGKDGGAPYRWAEMVPAPVTDRGAERE